MVQTDFDPDESIEGFHWGNLRGFKLLWDNDGTKRVGIMYCDGAGKFIKVFNRDLIFHSEKEISTTRTVRGLNITRNNVIGTVI